MRIGSRTSPETGEDVDGETVSDEGGGLTADGRSREVDRCTAGIDGLCFSVGSVGGEIVVEVTGAVDMTFACSVGSVGSVEGPSRFLAASSRLFRRTGGIVERPSAPYQHRSAPRIPGMPSTLTNDKFVCRNQYGRLFAGAMSSGIQFRQSWNTR